MQSVTIPAGVFTQVVWNLGNLAPDQVVTIQYAAGIPQRAKRRERRRRRHGSL